MKAKFTTIVTPINLIYIKNEGKNELQPRRNSLQPKYLQQDLLYPE